MGTGSRLRVEHRRPEKDGTMDSRLRAAVKRSIASLLASRGYAVARADELRRGTMEGAIEGISRRAHPVHTVIDVGASDGHWSVMCMRHYPKCNYLLIEAQPVHEPKLQEFRRKHDNADYLLVAAGPSNGEIFFDATDPFSGVASPTPFESNNIRVPVTTIDDAVSSRGLAGPYLIKLDTHGFEVPILKGAERALRETEVVVVECYNFKIAPECLLIFEMCDYLGAAGFRCIDMVDVIRRPRDGALWQMDLVFVRADRPEFSHDGYS
jgi:FkbM family methyltransferase